MQPSWQMPVAVAICPVAGYIGRGDDSMGVFASVS